VTWWREHKSSDRILIVLEEGVDIVWDRSANDFDFDVTDSLPRALSGAYAEEPRWIDVRWYEAEGSLGSQDPRWMERVADVAAAVRGAERDELIGENVREHRRARRFLRAGVSLLSLLLVASLVATFVAVGQRSEATKQRSEAVRQRDAATEQARIALARQLAAQAVSLAPTDLPTASLLAVEAYRTNVDSQTRAALFEVATASPQLVRTLPVGASVSATATTPDGVVVTGDVQGRVLLWSSGQPVVIATMSAPVVSLAVSDDASVVAATDLTTAVRWDGSLSQLSGPVEPSVVAVSSDGRSVAVSDDRHTTVWNDDDPPVTARTTFVTDLTFGDAGLVGFSTTGFFSVLDPSTGTVLHRGGHGLGLHAPGVAVSGDGSTLVGSPGGANLPIWRGVAAFDKSAAPNAVASGEITTPDIAVSHSGGLVAAIVDGFIDVAPVRSPSEPFLRPTRLPGAGAPDAFGAVSFGGDRYLASADGPTALSWDLGQLYRIGHVASVEVPKPCNACGPGRIAISPDGARALLWGLSDYDVGPSVVDLTAGTATPITDPSLGWDAVTWGPDGQVIGFRSSDSTLVSIDPDTRTETPLATVPADDSVLDLVAVAGLARLITRTGEVYSVDLASGDVTTSNTLAQDPRAANAAYWRFAPDGSTVAIVGYDLTQNESVVLQLDIEADQLTFAGPGLGMAYDSASRLHVFDGDTEETATDGALTDPRPAPGVAGNPLPVLSPDGSVLAANGREGDIQLLDLSRGGSEFGRLAVPQDNEIYPASAFTPDGQVIVTAVPAIENLSLPGTVRAVSLDPDDWIAASCAVAARDLTEDDWSRYGVGPAPDDLRCVQ
jgi:WD40 repeat protein